MALLIALDALLLSISAIVVSSTSLPLPAFCDGKDENVPESIVTLSALSAFFLELFALADEFDA